MVLAALALAALGSGCAGQDADEDARFVDPGSGGAAGAAIGPTSLEFEPGQTLKVAPGETRELEVVAKPPGSYRVRFALLGDPENASLDRIDADTDAEGRATVQLTAPTSATLFSVRASIGTTLSANAAISVSASGFAKLQVKPSYTGRREIVYWVASVRAGTTCAELPSNPPEDGDIAAQSLGAQSPLLDDVPVGPALAVTLRAAFFAGGCVEVENLVPGGELNTVVVPVTDRPIELAETNLDVVLGVDQAPTELAQLVAKTAAKAADAFVGGVGAEASALLEAMHTESGPAGLFAGMRQKHGWDALLAGALAAGGAAPLRGIVETWMKAGGSGLEGVDVLRGRLVSVGELPGYALFQLNSIAGIEPGRAGVPVQYQVAWSADPDDIVLLGAANADAIRFFLSPLLAELAVGPAAKTSPGASDVPQALSAILSCELVGQALSAAGDLPGEAFEGCDSACVTSLCERALETMWQRARDASAASYEHAVLDINATGAASVDDFARPRAFDGSWVGSLSVETLAASLGGKAVGSLPPPPN